MKKETSKMLVKKETLYAYVRVSTDEQMLKDLSIPRQKQLATEKAKELGMDIEIFSEGGESASQENFDNRPKLFSLLNLVKDGVAKHIWVFDQSRLSRNDITKAVILTRLKKSGAQVYTFSKMYDFNKHEDILTFNILSAIESYETALRKARFQLGYVSANQKGRFLKNITPYGYKKDENGFLIIDEDEKKVFLEIVDRYLKGYGTNQIAKWLNQENIPTKTSKLFKNGMTFKRDKANRKNTVHKMSNLWNPGSIITMLKHELYTGKRQFKTGKDPKTGKELFETVYCEPIFDSATFDRIQAQMKSNAINKTKLDKYFYLVKDLIQCGNCGNSMHGRVKPNRAEYTYRCNSKRDLGSKCTSRGINIDKLNAIVWNAYLSSIYYHKQITLKIHDQLQDSEILNTRMASLEKELKKMEFDEKVLSERKETLLRRASNPKFLGAEFDKVMNEILDEQKLIQDNKITCSANITMISRQIKDKDSQKSEIAKGVEAALYAKLETDAIIPPFKTIDMEQKARQIIKSYIKNIVITYNDQTKEHEIKVLFNDLECIKQENNKRIPYLTNVPSKTSKVKERIKVNVLKPVQLPTELIVNDEEIKISDTWPPTGQMLPPLQDSTKSLIVW